MIHHAQSAEKEATKTEKESAPKVSYHKQIRPIFQANCQGCHQPARAEGEYVMTTFKAMLTGGESETTAIIPGKPDQSYLIEEITPVKGKAAMPQGKKPLSKAEITLIRQWISEGAKDDSPSSSKVRFTQKNPPVYTAPSIVTAIDYSPDGSLLAISGWNEVLLVSTHDFKVTGRLVGLSSRIESVRFSPEGKRLLVLGGTPSQRGEVQIWDVPKRSLLLSVPMTHSIIRGGSWSPDGKKIAFGAGDNSVRAIDAKTGKQVLFQGAHGDWALETTFSPDSSHLVSVGRDMTVKLTDVKTERFVDNITSITPGALKGGISSVAPHPKRDEIVIGGADGIVKVYRIYRQTKRVIGDDANQIRTMPPMKGRIISVAVSADGKRIAAGSSLDGKGQVAVYSYEFDTTLTKEVKAILAKRVAQRSPQEKKQIADGRKAGVKIIFQNDIPETGIYTVAFSPDGKSLATAGADGAIRIYDAATGKVQQKFTPAPFVASKNQHQQNTATGHQKLVFGTPRKNTTPPANLPAIEKLIVEPSQIDFTNRYQYTQLLITGVTKSGDRIDLTRDAHIKTSSETSSKANKDLVFVSQTGLVRPLKDGKTALTISIAGKTKEIFIATQSVTASSKTASSKTASSKVDYIRDVTPVLSRVGCNQGTCHGAAKGKGGFKLSLRGYDPIFDVRALTDDLKSRRTNPASPSASMMLLKPTGAIPHVGGALMKPGDPQYELLKEWILNGASLDLKTARVTRIVISPQNPTIQKIGTQQQVRVIAFYQNGQSKDVTQEAFITSGNTEVSTMQSGGLLTAIRRGEAPVLARYEGAYAATTLTVMGQRDKFVWKQPASNNQIDKLVASKWKRMKITPSGLCTDAEFVRRIYLDLTGLPPTSQEVQQFLADKRATRIKREQLIDKLIGSEPFVEFWSNKWADLFQVNGKFLGREGATAFRSWIREQVSQNVPYDQFVHKVLTAKGSNKENPPASYYKILRTPQETMENTTHVFLGVRFNCNKCHDHPFERWTQDQYYEMAAYFAQVELKSDPASKGRKTKGTAVTGAKALFEIVSDRTSGEINHDRTGEVTPPKFPYDCQHAPPTKGTRREKLAAWMTAADNPYFAKSYVNRLWGYLLGTGIIEPIDDIRAGNPPTNPELLNFLTKDFIDHDFDMRHTIRAICKSRVYQLSIQTNNWNKDDTLNYSHAQARRLPAEVLYDSVHKVTGITSHFPGVPAGTRAAALPDSGIALPSDFLNKFGRPTRESACECERNNNLQLGQVMALINGPTIASAIANEKSTIAQLVASEKDDKKIINEMFLRILNRPAKTTEINSVLKTFRTIEGDHQKLSTALKAKQKQFAPIRKQLVVKRETDIASAQKELTAYEKKIAPDIAKKTIAWQKEITAAQQKLTDSEKGIGKRLAVWEKKQSRTTEWHPLEASSFYTSKGVVLQRLPDRSLLAKSSKDKADYTLNFPTSLRGITGIRLEAIPDSRLKSNGPGLRGNFVLSEIELKAAPKSKKKELKQVKFKTASADFSQNKYPPKSAIDGNNGGSGGWAISPATGTIHWAVFETKKPIAFEEGAILQIRLRHNHSAKNHLLGRFRISVTTQKQPIGVSLPESLKAILSTDIKSRTKEQSKTIHDYYAKIDSEILALKTALATAKKPLPIDAGILKRQERLKYAQLPVKEDAKLTQLLQDVKQSEMQLKNKRLTATQDLTWALINSPAFLFNH